MQDYNEELLDVIDDLRANSFDYYATIRSAYYQRRQALVSDMDPESAASPEIPDYGNYCCGGGPSRRPFSYIEYGGLMV